MTDDTTFNPDGCRDYADRRVRSDHDAVSVLHDAIQATHDDSIVSVNKRASHPPHDPDTERWEVRVGIETDVYGGSSLSSTVVGRLVEQDKARVIDVEYYAETGYVVTIRPVVTTVEPVEVDYDDVPDDVFYDPHPIGDPDQTWHDCHVAGETFTHTAIEDETEAVLVAAKFLREHGPERVANQFVTGSPFPPNDYATFDGDDWELKRFTEDDRIEDPHEPHEISFTLDADEVNEDFIDYVFGAHARGGTDELTDEMVECDQCGDPVSTDDAIIKFDMDQEPTAYRCPSCGKPPGRWQTKDDVRDRFESIDDTGKDE